MMMDNKGQVSLEYILIFAVSSSNKVEKIYFESTLPKSSIYISKGENKIIVEWPVNSENMKIYAK